MITKMIYENELHKLKLQLKDALQKINDYHGGKVQVFVKTYPNETTGLKSLVCHSEWIHPEDVIKRNDILDVEKK